MSKKHCNYRTAGGLSRQRLSPRIIPLCHYRGYINLFPPQILPPAAAIETWATPHWRLSGSCSNLSYLFAKYFYHRCSDNAMLQTAVFGDCINYTNLYLQSTMYTSHKLDYQSFKKTIGHKTVVSMCQ